MNRPGIADRLLAAAVRLLPASRREWGTAMRAELLGLPERRQRWPFTLGCLRVILTRPAVWRRVGYPLLSVAAVAAVVRGTAQVWYAPLRGELIGMVAVLVVAAWLGRVRPLGPVGAGLSARSMRAGGYLLIGVWTAKIVADMAGHLSNPGDQVPEAPVMAAVCLAYLLGLQALTAQRSPATRRVLLSGLVAGCAAAAAWTVTVVLAPPIPDDATPALVLTALAMVVAAVAAGADQDGGRGALLAAASAGTLAALLIVDVVGVLTAFGPARLIPDLAAAALSRADDQAQSRIDLLEPYLWLLLFGAVVAAGSGLAAARRPQVGARPVSGVGWPAPESPAVGGGPARLRGRPARPRT